MAINDTIRLYNIPYTKPTGDARFLGLALAEIQAELARIREEVGKSSSVPTKVIADVDISSLEAALAKLTPLPPENLDLNPVYRSYEDTAKILKELLGQVKSTNERIVGFRGGGGGFPSFITIKDNITGHKLAIDADGMLGFRPVAPAAEMTQFDYGVRTDGNPVYVGKALQGTPITDDTWKVNKFDYDSSARPTRIQTKTGAWTERSSIAWEA